MRLAIALMFVAGCDLVFELEDRPTASEEPRAFCVSANDEDADGKHDCQDPCPHIGVTGTEPDTDGDGLGDACDPTSGRDRLVLFDGFVDESGPYADFRGVRSGGTALFGAGQGFVLDGPFVQLRIELQFRADTTRYNASFGLAYGAALHAGTEPRYDGVWCNAGYHSEEEDYMETMHMKNGDELTSNHVVKPGALNGYDNLTGTMRLDARTTVDCSVFDAVSPPAVLATISTTKDTPAGAGVFSYFTDLQSQYVLVIARDEP